MTIRSTASSFACLFLVAALPLSARADAEAVKEFDALFGDAVKQAVGTPDPADDIALAKKLIEAAKTATDKASLAAVMLEKAYDLSARDLAGSATAIEAMEALADRLPDRKVAATQKILLLLQRDYTRAKPADLPATGGALIDKYTDLAEARAAAGDIPGAVSEYTKALPIASRIKSPQEASIRAQIQTLTHKQRIETQIASLKERILKDRTDKVSGVELVTLLISELDRPSAAQQYLDAVSDDEMKKNVPLAAKDASELTSAELLSMGTWYEGIAKKAGSIPAKRITLTRAERYIEAFIGKAGETEKLQATSAGFALTRIQTALKELAPEPAAAKEPAEKLFVFTGKPLVIEAEKAQVIEEPMKIEKTGSASGGAYIWRPGQIGQRTLDGGGHVVFHVKVAEATDVYIWGRVRSPDEANNSFNLAVVQDKVTTGNAMRWDLPNDTRNWTWAPYADARGGGGGRRGGFGPGGGRFGEREREPEPMKLKLEAGINSIIITPREHGAQLDQIYLSKTSEKPAGR